MNNVVPEMVTEVHLVSRKGRVRSLRARGIKIEVHGDGIREGQTLIIKVI